MNEADERLTHAGVLAVRMDRGEPQYLVISSSNEFDWVLPKGHIKAGEEPADAALRELEEEAGVGGTILAALPTQRFRKGDEEVRVRYYLVEATSFRPSSEGRSLLWDNEVAAVARLSFEDARSVIHEGAARLRDRTP